MDLNSPQPDIPIIHAIIPARSGSKGLARKNILPYKEIPLIAHSIKLATSSKYISKTVLTTDCEEIAKIGREYGAEVPFLRPKKISQDLSTDYEFMEHYLIWCEKHASNSLPEIIVQLRPTYPNRSQELLDDTIKTFIAHRKTHTSLRTVIPIEKSAFKMYTIETSKSTNKSTNQPVLNPIVKAYKSLSEPYNRCRQELPQTYLHNGCIDIINTATILMQKSVTGDNIYPYVMDSTENHDIDTHEDLKRSESRKYK